MDSEEGGMGTRGGMNQSFDPRVGGMFVCSDLNALCFPIPL